MIGKVDYWEFDYDLNLIVLQVYFKNSNLILLQPKTLTRKSSKGLKLWPKDFWDFLDHKSNLSRLFSVNSYILDPSKVGDLSTQDSNPQKLSKNNVPLDKGRTIWLSENQYNKRSKRIFQMLTAPMGN